MAKAVFLKSLKKLKKFVAADEGPHMGFAFSMTGGFA